MHISKSSSSMAELSQTRAEVNCNLNSFEWSGPFSIQYF